MSKLKSSLDKLGIKLILFDLDDTLVDTHVIFREKINQYFSYVSARYPDIDRQELETRGREINDRLFLKYGVNPKRWQEVNEELITIYGLDKKETFYAGANYLQEIYTTVPKLKEGVPDILKDFRAAGVRIGLVTHASVNWTNFKVDNLALRTYFEDIIIIDENGHKTSTQWEKAISHFKEKPKNTLVVGDNVKGDMIAAREAGVKYLVWYSQGSQWKLYREGELPKGTIVIDEIKKLPKALTE